MKNKLLLLFLVFTLKALCQSGEIDTTFGNEGKITTGFGPNQNYANDIAFQPDGKFLVGGNCVNSHGDYDFALARYNNDGSLDASFGLNGKAVIDFLEFNSNANYIHSIYVLPNGKIIVFGTISPGGSGGNTVAIVRYNANGTVDTSFGNNGKTVSELVCFGRYGNKIIFLPDGNFIITSVKYYGTSLWSFGVEKYTQDGLLDLTFGTNGQVFTSFGNGISGPCSIALKPDGKFVIAGSFSAGNSIQIAVAQYNPDGTLDTGFDGDGKVITTFGAGYNGYTTHLSVTPDGKIKVAAMIGSTINNFALVQYNANGSLDTTFDGDGKALTPIPQSESIFTTINSVARQPDGKYLLVLNQNLTAGSDFVVRRFNGDTSIDTTFGTAGRVATSIEEGFNEAQTAGVSPDGKIIVVGKSQPLDFDLMEFAIVRYDSTGALDPSLDGDGKLTTAFENADDVMSHLLVQSDDKLIAIGTSRYRQPNNMTVINIALSKYNADGSPDNSFGNSGKVVSVFGEHVNLVIAAGLQPDGKIVLGNMYYVFPDFTYLHELIRYNANGSLDAAFGTNGKIPVNYYMSSIAFQPDGKMLVAGVGTFNGTDSFILSRYNINGTLDTNFHTNGQLLISFGQDPFGNATVLLQPDGKIIFSGGSYNAGLGIGNFAAARFNPDGSSDATFGTNGQVVTTIAGTCNSLKGFIQPDGKIIIAGLSNGISFSTVRYLANGAIDTTYATQGISTTDLTVDSYYQLNPYSILLQSDGKFLVALTQYGQDANDNDFKIKRINTDGTFDTDFGGSAGITSSFYNGYDEAFAIGLQSDDRIVTAGSTHNGINIDFALTRYTNTILDVERFNEDQSGLVVYPNPAKDHLYIKTTAVDGLEIIGYSLYNMLGQIVYKDSGDHLEIQTAHLSKGIYSIAIDTNKGKVSKKFIKE